MFVSMALAAAIGQMLPIVVPLGKPRQIEQLPAPIEMAGPLFAARCDDWDGYEKPALPVRVFGNTYLVGTCGVSSILITDPAGDILIDGGTEGSADLIAANIEALGFRITDIKYLLHSHEHFDHVGGLAKLQRMSGAKLLASAAAAPVLSSGHPADDDPQAALNQSFDPARVDGIVKDGQQLRIGNNILIATATPGHTSGSLTWHWGSCERGVCRQIVYADSLTPVSSDTYRFSDHPAYLAVFRASIAKIGALDCDILLTPHPSASDMIKRLQSAAMENAKACRDYAAAAAKKLDERIATEAKGK